ARRTGAGDRRKHPLSAAPAPRGSGFAHQRLARRGEAAQALLPALARWSGDPPAFDGRMAPSQRLARENSRRVHPSQRPRFRGVIGMELIDRYVQAVGTYLPRAQRSDIVDELSEDLRCEVDDRERSLGRPLTESEEEAILLQRGHPMTVAGAYMPQRFLIGPALLPAYTFVLKLVIAVFAAIFLLVVGPIRIGEGASTFEAIATSAMSLWIYVWIPIGIVTVVFAAVERAQQRDA